MRNFDAIVESMWDEDYSIWREVDSKSVLDSDGFYTDYTWYSDGDGNHIFIFGDKDIYEPDPSWADQEISGDYSEAEEWFANYQGFADDLEESLKESYSSDVEALFNSSTPGDKWQYPIAKATIDTEVWGQYGTKKFDDGTPIMKYWSRGDTREVGLTLKAGKRFIVEKIYDSIAGFWVPYREGWVFLDDDQMYEDEYEIVKSLEDSNDDLEESLKRKINEGLNDTEQYAAEDAILYLKKHPDEETANVVSRFVNMYQAASAEPEYEGEEFYKQDVDYLKVIKYVKSHLNESLKGKGSRKINEGLDNKEIFNIIYETYLGMGKQQVPLDDIRQAAQSVELDQLSDNEIVGIFSQVKQPKYDNFWPGAPKVYPIRLRSNKKGGLFVDTDFRVYKSICRDNNTIEYFLGNQSLGNDIKKALSAIHEGEGTITALFPGSKPLTKLPIAEVVDEHLKVTNVFLIEMLGGFEGDYSVWLHPDTTGYGWQIEAAKEKLGYVSHPGWLND